MFKPSPDDIFGNRSQCGGPIGRHWLAGNSEGHRGNSKFFFLLAPNSDYGLLDTAIGEDAFF